MRITPLSLKTYPPTQSYENYPSIPISIIPSQSNKINILSRVGSYLLGFLIINKCSVGVLSSSSPVAGLTSILANLLDTIVSIKVIT